jgi:hypothetical protein
VIKEHYLNDIYKANETNLQPSKILTFCDDPFHDGTQPNHVLQFSLHVMLMVEINATTFNGQIQKHTMLLGMLKNFPQNMIIIQIPA